MTYSGSTVTPFSQNEQVMVDAFSSGQHKTSAIMISEHVSDSFSTAAAYTTKSPHVNPSESGTSRRALPALSPLGQKLQELSTGAGQHKGSIPFTYSHKGVPSSIVVFAADIKLAQVSPSAPGIKESGSAVMPSEHTMHNCKSIDGLAEFVGWFVIGDEVGDGNSESTAHSLDVPNARSNSSTLSKSENSSSCSQPRAPRKSNTSPYGHIHGFPILSFAG
mmetsp:Transcript_27573/g.50245  ORF Transcript_27573/g.50245 Transcript_27573/m.50245 type:complete len:220 (+) Transcript_27573:529-1188(+)